MELSETPSSQGQNGPGMKTERQMDDEVRAPQVANAEYTSHLKHASLFDIEATIEEYQDLVAVTPESHPDRALRFERLAIAHHVKFQRVDNTENLEAAIENYFRCVEATPKGHTERPHRLHYLNSEYEKTLESKTELKDLETTIQQYQDALDAVSADHPDRPRRLQLLAVGFRWKYRRTGVIEHLDRTIQFSKEALDLTLKTHSDWTRRLNNLGASYDERYRATGTPDDYKRCVQIYQEVLEATPKSHPNRAHRFERLGDLHANAYERTNAVSELDLAIQCFQSAVNVSVQQDDDRARRLETLGVAKQKRHQRLGVSTDLASALEYFQSALDITPSGHPRYGLRTGHVGMVFSARFLETGAVEDIERAIELQQRSISQTPEDHPAFVHLAYNLGNTYGHKYERTGRMGELDASIQQFHRAIDMTDEDGPDRARLLQNLGANYQSRYERLGALDDLRVAIKYYETALNETPRNHPDWPSRLQHVGVGYHASFNRTQASEDIDKAIQLYQESLDQTPSNHPIWVQRAFNVGLGYYARYQLTGDIDDLSKAIQCHEQSSGIAKTESERAYHLQSLAAEYLSRYHRLNEPSDLDVASHKSQDALELTPENDPERAQYLHYVATCFYERYKRTNTKENLEKSIKLLYEALESSYSSPALRFPPGKSLFDICVGIQSWSMAFDVATKLLVLVPLLIPPSLEHSDKQYLLAEVVGLASDGMAVALSANKDPYQALSLLELGRGVLISSVNDLRADILGLQLKHPAMAQQYIDLRDQLDGPTIPQVDQGDRLLQRSSQRYWASQRLQTIIEDIRKLPGFDRFLAAPAQKEVMTAATSGPIVIINISSLRCDALLVERDNMRTLPLPHLCNDDIKAYSARLSEGPISRELLEWMWDAFASDILKALEIVREPRGKWPRVWWIPTGPLSNFPIHAAGYHSKDASETVCDRVMSSYGSSIRTIIHAQTQSGVPPTPGLAVLVAMTQTPGHSMLPYANEELQVIESLCHSLALKPFKPQHRKKYVLSALQGCTIFHFAGHGSTHRENPLKSYLLLEDWKCNPLSVADVLGVNLHQQSPFLAYLSACGTGRIRNEKFYDESVHLMSAYQLAGFRHVIGTLWEVNDETCADIAKRIYEEMESEGLTDDSVCRGLHEAVRNVRDHWLNVQNNSKEKGRRAANKRNESSEAPDLATDDGLSGSVPVEHERDVVLCDENDDYDSAGLLKWVPYVHFGI